MIVVTAKLLFKSDKLDEAKTLLKELISETNLEDGCIEYKSYKSNSLENDILISEKWESKEHLDKHMKTKHFIEILPQLANLCEKDPEIETYSELI